MNNIYHFLGAALVSDTQFICIQNCSKTDAMVALASIPLCNWSHANSATMHHLHRQNCKNKIYYLWSGCVACSVSCKVAGFCPASSSAWGCNRQPCSWAVFAVLPHRNLHATHAHMDRLTSPPAFANKLHHQTDINLRCCAQQAWTHKQQ